MKHLIKTTAVISSLAPLSQAIISVHTITLDSIISGQAIFVDFSNGIADNSTTFNDDISLQFGGSEKPRVQFSNNNYSIADNGGYIARYSFGSDLNFTNPITATRYFERSNAGPWEGDTGGTSYFAVKNTTTSKEAWVAIQYNDAANTLDLISFAVADASDNITAGQTVVPEPAETAALMVLVAGSAALYRKRQQKKN